MPDKQRLTIRDLDEVNILRVALVHLLKKQWQPKQEMKIISLYQKIKAAGK